MTVLVGSNATLTPLRRVDGPEDPLGGRAPARWTAGTAAGGRADERGDGTWRLLLDGSAWPLADGDHVSDGARRWRVSGPAEPRRHAEAPALDHIACTAVLLPEEWTP